MDLLIPLSVCDCIVLIESVISCSMPDPTWFIKNHGLIMFLLHEIFFIRLHVHCIVHTLSSGVMPVELSPIRHHIYYTTSVQKSCKRCDGWVVWHVAFTLYVQDSNLMRAFHTLFLFMSPVSLLWPSNPLILLLCCYLCWTSLNDVRSNFINKCMVEFTFFIFLYSPNKFANAFTTCEYEYLVLHIQLFVCI